MRNVDKIKGLENQIEELKRQKIKLTKDRDTLLNANREIQAANNAVMISVALAYGTAGEDGSITLEFPKVDVAKNLSGYELHGSADGDLRRICVTPRTEAADGK